MAVEGREKSQSESYLFDAQFFFLRRDFSALFVLPTVTTQAISHGSVRTAQTVGQFGVFAGR